MSISPAELAALRADVLRMLGGYRTAVLTPDTAPAATPERAAEDDGDISVHSQSTMDDQKDDSPSAPRRRRTAPPRSKASRATR